MGLSGLWAQRARRDYTGAAKWGDGYNPVHEIHDVGRGRVVGARGSLYPQGEPSDVVSDRLTGREVDWLCEDYGDVPAAGEFFRYQDERPRWDAVTTDFRDATTSPAMGEWTPWGVYNDDDPTGDWPRPGPTGGMQQRLDISHGEDVEQQRAIAVPTPGVTGGWLGKVRGALALPEAQDPGQPGFVPAINTASVQGPGLKEMANDRAVLRGTDAPRSSIRSRTAGAVVKEYARSFGMGGGPGTPDMFPFQQTAGLKRPWVSRVAAVPPDEDHFMNTMEGRFPIERVMSPDPYQGDPEVGAGDVLGDWGY